MVGLPHVFIFLLAFLKAGLRAMMRTANPVPLPSEIQKSEKGGGGHSWFFLGLLPAQQDGTSPGHFCRCFYWYCGNCFLL